MAVVQPSGTVTMVFTDIEGSTRLLEELGVDAYRAALAEHRRVVREACARHAGYEVDYEGDAFFYAFASAQQAVAAVSEAMVGLEPGLIRIRVGIHTGEPGLDPPKYVGMDVHRAARIMAAAHGGQVVLSPSTVALLEAGSFELKELGAHRLKDLSAPIDLKQLRVGGLPDEFPPLKTLYRSNLPLPATPFLGRETELAAVMDILTDPDTRLLTLTGPGGTGKTRLALQAAAEVAGLFPDAITWVPLAALRDPGLVLATVAQALEVRDQPGVPLSETLARALEGKRALLLLDNLEHLLPAVAADVSGLLAACRSVRLVVTSRERLQLQAETVWPVPPLSESDGERLFTERARALSPNFIQSEAVGELCRRLDELPLAIELAAARSVVFSPEQLVERLGQRLDLLRGGRDTDPRQQTLRATIEWSHDLLTSEERRLFGRLSVFAGGCRFDLAEQVCDANSDTLQSLLDKSLLRRHGDPDGRPRYWMLETIREYAAEQLTASDDNATVCARFIDAYVALAEAIRPGCFSDDPSVPLRLFESELANIRSAILLAGAERPKAALAIASYFCWCWQALGLMSEAREWVAHLHAGEDTLTTDPRAWGYSQLTIAFAAFEIGDADSVPLFRSCLPLLADAGFPHEHALILTYLARRSRSRSPDEADALLQQAYQEAGILENTVLMVECIGQRAVLASARGDVDAAAHLYRQALDITPSGTYSRLALLVDYADSCLAQRDPRTALAALQEARSIAVGAYSTWFLSPIEIGLAFVALLDGDADQAEHYIGSARPAAEGAVRGSLLASLALAQAGAHVLRGETNEALACWRAAVERTESSGASWSPGERAIEDDLLEPLAASPPRAADSAST